MTPDLPTELPNTAFYMQRAAELLARNGYDIIEREQRWGGKRIKIGRFIFVFRFVKLAQPSMNDRSVK